MQIVITYATNSSGTYEAGKIIRDVAEKQGHDVRLISVIETTKEHLEAADFIIFGSNTWDGKSPEGKRLEGQLPPHFHEFRSSLNKTTFPKKRCAVYGLGDTSYTYVCASADHLKDFVSEIEGTLVGEPLRVVNFLFGMDEKEQEIRNWAEDILKELK